MRRTFAACLVLSPVVLAQEPPQKVVSGELGVDVTSQYFFRGILQENQGVIVQPRIELGYDLYQAQGEGTLQSLDLRFGLWNSLQDGPGNDTGGIWYESDFYVEIGSKLGQKLGVSAAYWTYQTPNATPSFSKGATPVEELVFRVDYDDRGEWGESVDSGLRPWVLLAIEVDGQRDVAVNGHVGTYLELGIEPTFEIGKLGDDPLLLSVPTKLGLSLGDYYEDFNGGDDDFFGYFSVGAELSAALGFLPAGMGPWEGFAALHFLLLGDNNEARNVGDSSELVFQFGASTFF